jgi:triosephosphate isomerase
MKNLLIVANLKSYKTEIEAKEWLEAFKKIKEFEQNLSQKETVICPPFTLLSLFHSFILDNALPASVGAQNISSFDEGAYTGEINARQVKDFAEFVLVGHSERRKNFNEKEEELSRKVEFSLKHGLTPIFLVSGSDDLIPAGVKIVAYEPVFAIGSGTPDNPENANSTSAKIKGKNVEKVLYGGSVNPQNVKSFTGMENIDGVLVGGASLDAKEFIEIVQNA